MSSLKKIDLKEFETGKTAEEARDIVLEKIKKNIKGAQMNIEDLKRYAVNLSNPEALKAAYLNKEFEGIKKMVRFLRKNFLHQQFDSLPMTKKTSLPSSGISDIQGFEEEDDDIDFNFDELQEQEQNPRAQVKDKVSVKLIIAEIAKSKKEKTIRKLLSPVMNNLDIGPSFGWFHSALIIGPWYIEW